MSRLQHLVTAVPVTLTLTLTFKLPCAAASFFPTTQRQLHTAQWQQGKVTLRGGSGETEGQLDGGGETEGQLETKRALMEKEMPCPCSHKCLNVVYVTMELLKLQAWFRSPFFC